MDIARWLLVAALLVCATGATRAHATGGDVRVSGPCRPSPTVRGVTEGQSLPGSVAPSTGTLRAVFLLVHAADAAADESVEAPQPMIDAAAAWFRAVSYGRLEFRVETLPRWLPLPARSAVYVADAGRYLADAVAVADPYVDFSQIDVVYLAPALRTPDPRPVSAILNGFGVQADGRQIGLWVPFDAGFAAFPESVPSLLLHETGHLLGLPDLYLAGVTSSFHRWDLMTGPGRWPSELLAWHRWKLDWLDAGQIVCVTGPVKRVVTLAPLERPGGTKAVVVRRGGRTFVAEVRARLGYDSSLCETGVLVYEVDQTRFRRGPVRIRAAQPDGVSRGSCSPQWNAPFDIGRGEVRTFRLPWWGLRLELVAKLPDGSYRIRVATS